MLPGFYNSDDSWRAFHEMSAVIFATGAFPVEKKDRKPLTVAELGEQFLAYCAEHYPPDSREPNNQRYAVEAMVELWGSMLATEFEPHHLKAVRKSLIKKGQVRNTVNRRATQIVGVFQWATEEGLVASDLWQRLKSVKRIQPGREGAVDNAKIQPVSNTQYEETLKELKPEMRRAIMVQAMTGMRSGELVAMRPQDVTMTGDHWIYRLKHHKTKKHIGETFVAIPRPAVAILQACFPKSYADRWFPWTTGWVRKSIYTAAARAGVEKWHPHQLRHKLATEITEKIGKEAAQRILRHTNPRTTDEYAKETIDGILNITRALHPESNS